MQMFQVFAISPCTVYPEVIYSYLRTNEHVKFEKYETLLIKSPTANYMLHPEKVGISHPSCVRGHNGVPATNDIWSETSTHIARARENVSREMIVKT